MAVAGSVATRQRQRTLSMLVLASGRGACMGVDLDSGALAVAQWPGGSAGLGLFDQACGVRADEAPLFDAARPEAVALERPPVHMGRVRRRAAERVLRPLLLGPRDHLLGIAGVSVPYWTLTGERPSLCLVAPPGGVVVTAARTCRFAWRSVVHELPLAGGALARTGAATLSGAPLADVLGFVPRRVLVALSPPRDGVCHKVAAALLP
jgi:hypothetical protein